MKGIIISLEKELMSTYFGHGRLALEATPYSVIDTFWFSPSLLYAMVAVGLMTPGYISLEHRLEIHATLERT